jgi:hypothetical protein
MNAQDPREKYPDDGFDGTPQADAESTAELIREAGQGTIVAVTGGRHF